MKTTIILAHPWHGSFNKAILDAIVTELQSRQKEFTIVDLYKDHFDSALSEEDLALYSKGLYTDELVRKYQEILMETKELIIIFPIWWYNVPAVLKGFLDKVLLKDFAFTEIKTGLKGKLTHITKATVITTSESPTWYLKYFRGNTIEHFFIKGTLHDIGIKNATWLNSDRTTSGTDGMRKDFLKKAVKLISSK